MLEHLDADDDVEPLILRQRRDVSDDQSSRAIRCHGGQPIDRHGGDVEPDEVEAAFDEWEVVPTDSTTDVEPILQTAPTRRGKDVLHEADRRLAVVAPSSVLRVPGSGMSRSMRGHQLRCVAITP